MTISAAIVLYFVVWFLCLFLVLPIAIRSQSENDDVVPGTPASAPSEPKLRKRFIIVTIIATIIWAILCWVILTGMISVRDIDFFNRMGDG